ncbi:MAG: T9SS type A sorting domain-containing protein [Vicingaceae bacterium]
MKNYIISFCVFLISSTVVAQSNLNWTTLNTGSTKKINAIYFHNPDTGYIVGADYLFKKTTDGGMTWVDLTAPTIGEKPGNNGNIVGIDFQANDSFNASNSDSALHLSWEKPYHGIFTRNDGMSFSSYQFGYSIDNDSSLFCSNSGFSALARNGGNGYVQLITFGQNCSGDAVYSIYNDGPFFTIHTDTSKSFKAGTFTDVAADSFSTIFSHSNGYLLKYNSLFSRPDSIFLDSSGVAAIAYAGNHKWYASTNRNSNNMYVSVDSGKTFSIDRSYTIFLNPKLNEFSFLENGIGIAAATNNVTSGAILIQKDSTWSFDTALQPLNAAQILEDGTAYVAGDSGLVMKTTILTTLSEVNQTLLQWQVYPNPAKDLVYLDGLEAIAVKSIQLMDIHGRLIQSFSSQQTQLDVSELPKGTYILKVITEEQQQLTKKLLKR